MEEDELREIKALEVASLFADRYYRHVVVPHLIKYKSTVFFLLKEEETRKSLIELEKLLKMESDIGEDIVFH